MLEGCIYTMTNQNSLKQEGINLIASDKAFDLVKDEIKGTLLNAPLIIRKYTEHLTLSTGKYIRAMSLLTCAENKDGYIHENAVKFAAAIEILHLATLVHDDIIDDADIRRGVITLQKKYDKKTAVICGDYLMCMAARLAASVPNRRDYLDMNAKDYVSRICLGELNQHINNGYLDLSVYNYLKIIAGKTAALFEASFYLGAILCEKDEKVLNKYMRLGKYIGMIFQMTDDCINFDQTEDVAQKPVLSDYEQGVITLPLIYAFKQLTGFKEKARNSNITKAEIKEAVEISGGLGYTLKISNKYYKKCMNIIDELDLTESKRKKLTEILNKASRMQKK